MTRPHAAWLTALLIVLLIVLTGGCSPADTPEAPAAAESSTTSEPTEPTEAEPTAPEPSPASTRPPVPDDLRRLARAFIAYALEETDTLPVAESILIGLDGQRIKAVDGMPDPLTDRRIWEVCPGAATAYAAFSCPLDVLSPIRSADMNDLRLRLTRDAEVVCARADIPEPHGRFIVIRPVGALVSCVNNFALVLTADRDGRLTQALLTVSEP